MSNRPVVRAVRLGAVALAVAAAIGSAAPARAATVEVGFNQEGTFWRQQQRAPIVDIPCTPPVPADRCGPASPGPTQAPNVTEGNVAVGHKGGQVESEGGDVYGDEFWAVFELDLLSIQDLDTVDKLELTVTRAPDARGDYGTATIMACNVVTPFGVSEGTNPWADRPKIDCNSAKAPTASFGNINYKFNLTDFASTWVAGTGYGVAIVPGVPGTTQVVNDQSRTSDVAPFQVTFVSGGRLDATRKPHPQRARAALEYQPKADGGDGDLGLDFGGEGDLSFGLGGDVEDLAGADDLGDLGEDVGSDLTASGTDGSTVEITDTGGRRLPSRRASSSGGFPWIVLLLLPAIGVAFWGTGTALSEAGDPVLPREGGVSRILARRRAEAPTDPIER